MNKELRKQFLTSLTEKFGEVRKLEGSQSLFEVGGHGARVYLRYSKVHGKRGTFYGLRREDLRRLEGRASFLVFLWEGQGDPLIVPFSDYEEVFAEASPASDGQYKVQVLLAEGGTFLYVGGVGRFSVDAFLGWAAMENAIGTTSSPIPRLSHSQVQTLLGAIGITKNFDVWIPPRDRHTLDWSMASPFSCLIRPPSGFGTAEAILQEIDVVWVHRGSNIVRALYEVEHSTPIYSALLRFNDVRMAVPSLEGFTVVSNEARRSLFVRQLRRPTFVTSGLSDACAFLEYPDVYRWHRRLQK